MRLSVVMPVYNEEKDLFNAIDDILKVLPDSEIIVINDASTDKTSLILESIRKDHFINLNLMTNENNMGHGYSVVRGLKEAKGDYILYIDADRQISLENIKKLNTLKFDFASGCRIHRQDKPFRKFISFCLKITNVLFHGYYIKDANCPFKVYRRETLLPLLEKLPTTYVVPVACLEVLARKASLKTCIIDTPHLPYEGERKGFLQILNISALKFFGRAFLEVISLR